MVPHASSVALCPLRGGGGWPAICGTCHVGTSAAVSSTYTSLRTCTRSRDRRCDHATGRKPQPNQTPASATATHHTTRLRPRPTTYGLRPTAYGLRPTAYGQRPTRSRLQGIRESRPAKDPHAASKRPSERHRRVASSGSRCFVQHHPAPPGKRARCKRDVSSTGQLLHQPEAVVRAVGRVLRGELRSGLRGKSCGVGCRVRATSRAAGLAAVTRTASCR